MSEAVEWTQLWRIEDAAGMGPVNGEALTREVRESIRRYWNESDEHPTARREFPGTGYNRVGAFYDGCLLGCLSLGELLHWFEPFIAQLAAADYRLARYDIEVEGLRQGVRQAIVLYGERHLVEATPLSELCPLTLVSVSVGRSPDRP